LSIKGPQLLKIGFQNPNNLLPVSPNNWTAAMCTGMVLLFPLENKKKGSKLEHNGLAMHAIVPTEKESLFPFHFGDE